MCVCCFSGGANLSQDELLGCVSRVGRGEVPEVARGRKTISRKKEHKNAITPLTRVAEVNLAVGLSSEMYFCVKVMFKFSLANIWFENQAIKTKIHFQIRQMLLNWA